MSAPDAAAALAALRSRAYVGLLLLTALIGVPISAIAYGFLRLVALIQSWVFTELPQQLGFDHLPLWWPLPWLSLSGVFVALAIRYLPGEGGHHPADGFQVGGGPPTPVQLPGIALAAIAGLGLGVVLGPEAPLVALGGGLGALAVHLLRSDSAERALAPVAAAGSFASISALLGSPILGAFLLMEAAGVAGATLEVVLVPGLLAAGIGSLVFLGLDSFTGWGTFSLAINNLPSFDRPELAQFGWALLIGLAAALLGTAIRAIGLFLRARVGKQVLIATPLLGLLIGGLAVAFVQSSGASLSLVLFSGQSSIGEVMTRSSSFAISTLLLLIAFKGLAYGVSLGAFRGGPVFPSMFLGAAGGVALAHLPGLSAVPGGAMGIGAMCAVMLKLPMTSVLLATVLFSTDGLALTPLVIVAVVVAYVTSMWLQRPLDQRAPAAIEGAGVASGSAADA